MSWFEGTLHSWELSLPWDLWASTDVQPGTCLCQATQPQNEEVGTASFAGTGHAEGLYIKEKPMRILRQEDMNLSQTAELKNAIIVLEVMVFKLAFLVYLS